MQVQELMTKKVVTISLATTLIEVVDLMQQHKFSSLPVVDEQNYLRGVVRQEDLMSHNPDLHLPSYIQFLEAMPKESKAQVEVNETLSDLTQMQAKIIMSTRIPVVSSNTDARVAAAIFAEHHVSTIPVVDDDDKLVGLVSRSDLLSLLSHPKKATSLTDDLPKNYNYKILQL